MIFFLTEGSNKSECNTCTHKITFFFAIWNTYLLLKTGLQKQFKIKNLKLDANKQKSFMWNTFFLPQNQEMMEVLQEYENKLYRSTNETAEYKQKDFAYTLFIKILQEQFFNFSWKTWLEIKKWNVPSPRFYSQPFYICTPFKQWSRIKDFYNTILLAAK